jgi:hypothetical protein
VASDELVKYEPKWAQSLHGDKTASCVFDNRKVKEAVGGWECRFGLRETLGMSAGWVKKRLVGFKADGELGGLMERIIAEHA